MVQLDHIGHYMNDFKTILNQTKADRTQGRSGAAAQKIEEDSDESNWSQKCSLK